MFRPHPHRRETRVPSSSIWSPEAAAWLCRAQIRLVSTANRVLGQRETSRASARSRLVLGRTGAHTAFRGSRLGRCCRVGARTPRSSGRLLVYYGWGAGKSDIEDYKSETHSRSMLDSPSRCLILGLREIETHRARKRFSVMMLNIDSPTAFCI